LWADADQGADRVAERARIDLGPVGHDAGVLQTAEPLGDGGRGQADPAGQLADAQPGVSLQLGEDGAVDLIQRDESVMPVVPSFDRVIHLDFRRLPIHQRLSIFIV
jgi:hypothetical protein